MQHVFPKMGYEGWVGLSRSAMKAKALPYREAMKEMWVRLRRSHPEMKTSAKPFVKDKWDVNALKVVQDLTYAAMDAGQLSLNEGLTVLMVLAMLRLTCQRSGSMAKDVADIKGLTVWKRGGKNVLNVGDLTFDPEGLTITHKDGRIEKGTVRGQLQFNRVKHHFFEAAADGYKVSAMPCTEHRLPCTEHRLCEPMAREADDVMGCVSRSHDWAVPDGSDSRL